MPKENFPPPSPIFLLNAYSIIVSSIYLASCLVNVTQDQTHSVLPPPVFLVFSVNALFLLLTALSAPEAHNTYTPLVRALFRYFHGKRSRGRDVWQALQLNPVLFWYMTGETPVTLEEVVEKSVQRGNFTKTLASNAANGQETTLHSRCKCKCKCRD